MKERLQQLLNKEQLTPVRFAELVGVQRSSVSHILSGRNNPSLDFIQKILLKFPQISSDWLINGIGEIYRDQAKKQAKTPDLFEASKNEAPFPNISQAANEGSVGPKQAVESRGDTEPILVESAAANHSTAVVGTPSEVERIVVFYKDRTFRAYDPE